MGFLREYGIIIAIVLTLGVIGFVWVERGVLDNGKIVTETEKAVQPIQLHEENIGRKPLDGSQLLHSLQRGKY